MDSSPSRLRQAVRALVVDPDDAILLVCFPTDTGNYWATPGGGREPGESAHEALKRELVEELGQTSLEIGPLLWTRTSWFAVSDNYDGQYNEIFLVRAPHFDPNPQIGWDGMRAEGVTDIRWWTLDEIDAAPPTELFVPADIAALTRDLLANGPSDTPRSVNATSFGTATAAYERGRPSYPDEAVRWLTEPLSPGARVCDVGAGTGKLTRALDRFGFEVTAIDPDAGMLRALSGSSPHVATLVGSAEELDAPDGSFDAATFGQSWHWVDAEAASLAVGRIVRPGGLLGLVWNLRDERVDWVREMTEVIRASPAERIVNLDTVQVGGPFGPLTRFEVEWARRMTRPDLVAMVQSRSYYLTANPNERARIDRRLDGLLDEIGLVGDTTLEHPYVTHVFRCERM